MNNTREFSNCYRTFQGDLFVEEPTLHIVMGRSVNVKVFRWNYFNLSA